MKIATWDSGLKFDDPNLRWGSPSYLLEPGDPGYVPPVPPPIPATETKKKTKRMKHNKYYPIRVANQIAWLLNFADKLPGHATVLGLTPAQVTALVADCLWLAYVLQNWLNAVRTFSLACTQTATIAQTGTGSAAVALDTFTPPALPATVTPQLPGSLTRIFAAVQDLKNGHKLTDDIARELGILAGETAVPHLAALQPVLTLTVSGGKVEVKWGWTGHGASLDACEIQVDRGDGKGFNLLTIDTTPGYTDTQPFPAGKAVWTYKAIYRVDDQQVGQWSQPVSVAVGA